MNNREIAKELVKVAKALVGNEFEKEFLDKSKAFEKDVKDFSDSIDKYLDYLKKNEKSHKMMIDRSGGSVADIENLLRRVKEKPMEMKELAHLLKKVQDI